MSRIYNELLEKAENVEFTKEQFEFLYEMILELADKET